MVGTVAERTAAAGNSTKGATGAGRPDGVPPGGSGRPDGVPPGSGGRPNFSGGGSGTGLPARKPSSACPISPAVWNRAEGSRSSDFITIDSKIGWMPGRFGLSGSAAIVNRFIAMRTGSVSWKGKLFETIR